VRQILQIGPLTPAISTAKLELDRAPPGVRLHAGGGGPLLEAAASPVLGYERPFNKPAKTGAAKSLQINSRKPASRRSTKNCFSKAGCATIPVVGEIAMFQQLRTKVVSRKTILSVVNVLRWQRTIVLVKENFL
jgi:hypothetical protein